MRILTALPLLFSLQPRIDPARKYPLSKKYYNDYIERISQRVLYEPPKNASAFDLYNLINRIRQILKIRLTFIKYSTNQ
jgi:hypothetical protein